jgi:lysophospholipase L1-like esterase
VVEAFDLTTTTRAPARPRRIMREILLQVAIMIATLGLAEVILRAVDLRELRDGYGKGYSLVYRYDAELGWFPIPNASSSFTGTRTIAVRNNSLGLRDIEHDRTPRPTALFLGDSFVWGYDVEANERFTELLRKDLPGMRIVNAGVSGYGTDQEYLLLQRIWGEIKPDVVVLMFCVGNDRIDNTANVRNGGYLKPYLQQAADGAWRFAGQPVPQSRYVYFNDNVLVRNLWLARAAVTAYVYFRHPAIELPDPTEQLVGMMRAFVAARGAKFVVGVQEHEAGIETFLRTQDIPYTTFDGAELYPDDGNHWTPKGHALVASRLMSLFAAAGIVDAAKPDRAPASPRALTPHAGTTQ